MKKQNLILLVATAIMCFACKKIYVPEVYEGINIIYLEAEKDPVLTLGAGGEITVLLKSTYKALHDTRFELSIKPLDETASAGWVKINEPELILKKGERELKFHLSTLPSAKPKEELTQYEININEMPNEQMKLEKPLRFRLLNIEVPPLSEAQLKLIEGYKAKGIDITPFLGKKSVKTTVSVPAGGNIKDFENPWQKTYEGFTVFTLSQHATADQPILKMVYNALGMNDFFHFALRKETIENYEYWYDENSGPLFKEIRSLIHWTDKSVERFNVTLDSIRLGVKNGDNYKISVLGNNLDNYGDATVNVPFHFQYSAWDRLKKMIDEKNLKAIECHTQGATSFPGNYINISGTVKDEYSDENQPLTPVSEGQWMVNENKMIFTFYTSVYDAGWYIAVTTEYSGQ